jgi:adenine phosphoribosyltransferase
MLTTKQLDELILRIPDHPIPGVIFQDITTLLADPEGFNSVINYMSENFMTSGITHVIGIEARGFLLASAIAYRIGAGLVPARKLGKLPRTTQAADYKLEYGIATVEIHQDAFTQNAKVLIVDDVLATGGTLGAVISILEKMAIEVVGISVISEILELQGRKKFPLIPVHAVLP